LAAVPRNLCPWFRAGRWQVQERQVKVRVHDRIAIVTMDGADQNLLSTALRAGLWEAFGRVCSQDGVQAVILCGAGPRFSAGLNLRAPDLADHARGTARLCRRIETCPKPVIAALSGRCAGAGADLALAAHYRVATPDAALVWPDVSLGLVPGAGGGQRLTRLIGAEAALAALIRGQPVPAGLGQRLGLIDGIVNGDLASGAVAFARTLVEAGKGARPAGGRRDKLRDGTAHLHAVSRARAALAETPLVAPARIVDCVEAAGLLPYEAALAFEEDALAQCLAHPQHRALLHVFLAERTAPPALLASDDDGFRPTEDGRSMVARLRGAWEGAARHIAAAGMTEAAIDAAMVAFGFRKGPFGGRAAGAEDAMLTRRMTAALIVEGARIIADHGLHPATIDALAVHGMGYPRRHGGPFRTAQTMGLLGLRSDMRGWGAEAALFAPPALLDEAIKDARGFDAL